MSDADKINQILRACEIDVLEIISDADVMYSLPHGEVRSLLCDIENRLIIARSEVDARFGVKRVGPSHLTSNQTTADPSQG